MEKEKDVFYPEEKEEEEACYPEEIDETEELKEENEKLKKELALLKTQLALLRLPQEVSRENSPENHETDYEDPVRFLPGGNVEFGRYPQGENGEIRPLEWRVLEKREGEMLVISEYALDLKQYHEFGKEITWETCELRRWLNDEFLRIAFDSKERGRILSAEVPADPNPDWNTSPGNDTRDYVFLLSIQEADRYFKNKKDRRCQATLYGRKQGISAGEEDLSCAWGLRTPGANEFFVPFIMKDGCVWVNGMEAGKSLVGLRPAMWISLSAGLSDHPSVPSTKDSAVYRNVVRELPNGNVEFGHYPQGENGEVRPIEWRLLKDDGIGLLLISEYALDCRQYHNRQTSVCWKDCSLREWLNHEFYETAFSEDEKDLIQEYLLGTRNATELTLQQGKRNDMQPLTNDKVYLLSDEEAEEFFRDDRDRRCRPSPYARLYMTYVSSAGGLCEWWLRSPGYHPYEAAVVADNGRIGRIGGQVTSDVPAVRPVIRIEKEKVSF